jgi:hypothetical protein
MNAIPLRPALVAPIAALESRRARLLAGLRQQARFGAVTILFTPAEATPQDLRAAARFLIEEARKCDAR